MGYKNQYKNMGRSNLTFLNVNGSRRTHKQILEDIQKQLDAELAKISYTDPQGDSKRAAVFATAENNIKAENQRYEVEKAKRLDDLFGIAQTALTLTQSGLSTLGIKPPEKSADAPIGGKDSYQEPPKDNTLLIVGGVIVALGIVGFVIYKVKK